MITVGTRMITKWDNKKIEFLKNNTKKEMKMQEMIKKLNEKGKNV